MAAYEVIEAQRDRSGWLVKFQATEKPSWWDRIRHRPGDRWDFWTHTENGVVWRSFPELKRLYWRLAESLEEAFKRWQLLNHFSDEGKR